MEIYDIISKFVLNEASAEEVEYLNAWRRESKDNEREFQEVLESWELSGGKADCKMPNKELVWMRIAHQINPKKVIRQYSSRIFYRAIGLTAVIALLIGISLPWFLASPEETKYMSFVVPQGQKAQVDLPDGTRVFLNSDSKLTYSTKYGIENRNVTLEGQAFFDVMKDKKRTFEVMTGGLKVVVHGTSFDVNAYHVEKEVEVTLLSGSVSVCSVASNKVLFTMKPNQQALVESSGRMYTLRQCEAEEESLWRYGQMKIVGENMYDIAHKMENWYGVKITLENVDMNKHYWMTIKTESLREMLEIIDHISPIDYSINGEEVHIRYK